MKNGDFPQLSQPFIPRVASGAPPLVSQASRHSSNGSRAGPSGDGGHLEADHIFHHGKNWISCYQLIGLREKLQEHPIFRGKIYGFL